MVCVAILACFTMLYRCAVKKKSRGQQENICFWSPHDIETPLLYCETQEGKQTGKEMSQQIVMGALSTHFGQFG